MEILAEQLTGVLESGKSVPSNTDLLTVRWKTPQKPPNIPTYFCFTMHETESPNPHLMNIAGITRALASNFWRKGWGCNLKVGSSSFHMQQTVIHFLLILPNGNYFLYHLITSFDKGGKTLHKSNPSLLPYLQTLSESLHIWVLSPMFRQGHRKRKSKENWKGKQKDLNFPFDSITFCKDIILHLWLSTVLGNPSHSPALATQTMTCSIFRFFHTAQNAAEITFTIMAFNCF